MVTINKLLLGATLLASVLGSASAQSGKIDPEAMASGGLQVIQMIDQGQAGELWDGATSVTKKRVSRNDFVQQVGQSRRPLGTAQQRVLSSVNLQTAADGDPEVAGQYINVEYQTRFSNASDRLVREMTTFRLDGDNTWRFSGYVLR